MLVTVPDPDPLQVLASLLLPCPGAAHVHQNMYVWGHSEPAPTNAPWRMDDKWSGNSFLLCSSSLANHGG